MKLEDDRMCFVCGVENKLGLHLKFVLHDDKTMTTEFTPRKEHQGFKDVVHGGIIGTVMDEIMVNLPWKLGIPAVSAEFRIRLKKPVKVGSKLLFKSWIKEDTGRVIYTEAEARSEDGTTVALSSATCVRTKS